MSEGNRRDKLCELATKSASEGNYDIAALLFAESVLIDPGNVSCVRNFIDSLQRKCGKKNIGPLALFKERGDRTALDEAISYGWWFEALLFGLAVLMVDPRDVSTLTAMATAYKNIADAGEGPAYARFADCSLFYAKCAADASR